MVGWSEVVEDVDKQVVKAKTEAKELSEQIKDDEERVRQLQQELERAVQALEEKKRKLEKLEDKQEALGVLKDTLGPIAKAEEKMKEMIEEVKAKEASMWSAEEISIFLQQTELSDWIMPFKTGNVNGEVTESKEDVSNMIEKEVSLRDWKRFQYCVSRWERKDCI